MLLYEWQLWARPKQLPPSGDWRVWLLMAGRGFGKTRAGAEWIRWLAQSGRARHIALVGETFDDARHVMVEGMSGILSVCPKWARPAWRAGYTAEYWIDIDMAPHLVIPRGKLNQPIYIRLRLSVYGTGRMRSGGFAHLYKNFTLTGSTLR